MPMSTNQERARALHRHFVKRMGGTPNQITLVAGTGTTVGVYEWTDASGNVARTGWQAVDAAAAATERAAIGL